MLFSSHLAYHLKKPPPAPPLSQFLPPPPAPARPLPELLRPALADALKAQGFAAADILRHWQDIAGPRLAPVSMPVRILFPPRPKAAPPDAPPQPATLILKVESAFALEVE